MDPDEEVTPEAPPDFSRRVVSTTGEVYEFPTAEEAAAALRQTDVRGTPLFAPDTAEAAAERAGRREYGGRTAEATVAGLLRGPTMGLSDIAASALGPAGTAEYLRNLETYNPEASTAGEIAGTAAGLLLPVGALGTVGRAVTAPVRGVTAIAEAAGGAARAAVTGAGAGLGRRLAGRAAGLAAEGAIEGAAASAGRLLTEEAMGYDPDLGAEAIMSAVGSGAMTGATLGGVLGAGLGTVGEVASTTAGMVSRAWRSRVGTELSPVVAEALASAGGAAGRGEFVSRALSSTESGRALRSLIERGDEVYDTATREIADSTRTLVNDRAEVTRVWGRGMRPDYLEGLVRADGFADQLTASRASIANIRDTAETLISDYGRGPEAAAASAFLRRLRGIEDDIELLASRTDLTPERRAAELFNATDTIKREMGTVASRARGEAATRFRDAYEPMRQLMEDAALWGDGAAMAQRTVNHRYSRWLDTADAFDRAFLTEGVETGARATFDPFQRQQVVDTAKLNPFLRSSGTVANDTRDRLFRDTIQSQDDLLRALDETLPLSEAERATVTRGREAARRTRDVYERMSREAADLNQFRALQQASGAERLIAGGLVGTALGGALGGAVAGALTSPTTLIRGLAAVDRMASGVVGDISRSVADFLRVGGRAAARAGAAATDVAQYAGVRAYQERTRRLDRETGDLRATIDTMAREVEGMDSTPRTRDALLNAVTRRNAFLASVRPSSRALPGQIVPTPRPPSRAEVSRFNAAARIADNPLQVIRDMRDGTLTRESVAALRAVYPRMYQQIVTEVQRQIAESGTEIPYQQRLALGILLGVPTDPALVPANMATLQATYQAAPDTPPARSPRPAPRLAEGLETATDRLEA